MPVVNNYGMSTGGANFGADVSIPGMKIAAVARASVYRSKVKSYYAPRRTWSSTRMIRSVFRRWTPPSTTAAT